MMEDANGRGQGRRGCTVGLWGVLGLAGMLVGCASLRTRLAPQAGGIPFDEAHFAHKPMTTFRVALGPDGRPRETVIGTPGSYRIHPGDTFLDVARYYDLGYNEIVAANPGVDPWVPPVGTAVVLPTARVLPCCRYEGIVLNIPELRLYFYRPAPGDPRTLLIDTYPVGLGREDRRTPRGRFRVRGKTVDPRWNVPASIREEHRRERGDDRASIPGGDPDNPLGKYRIELSVPLYSIHGTNVPWGAGMLVSHGCARLYPEDIARLFPSVTTGMPVDFVYQPVKVGVRRDATFVEVHPDLYRYTRSLYGDALAALHRSGQGGQVDRPAVRALLHDARGFPVRLERRPTP